MSFGLNKFLKIILPKSLFYRALIIVAAPIILLQITITIVFFDSVWIKANKGMTRSLVAEIKTLSDLYGENKKQIEFLKKTYKKNFNFTINVKNEILPEVNYERKFSPMDRSLRRELKSAFNNNYWFNTTKYKKIVEVRIRFKDSTLQFLIPKKNIAASSFRLFLLWITLPSLVLVFIAILFLKNQTRPIVNLAKAAERFGKGDYVNEFRASGASEIRKASYEFDRMAKRINRHLNQRSEMLSGISHDLRTPLTRLKLQLAMLSQKDISEKMSKDIDEMEKMLNNYLNFAKSQTQEDSIAINASDLIKEISNDLSSSNFHLSLDHGNQSVLIARRMALKRCLNNFIQNGLAYGKNVYVNVVNSTNRLTIKIEDDGPGIPVDEYKNVFKPFYRLDKSRGLNKAGVGLGMSISEDIINSHGGSVQLSKSSYGGLQVKISLPY
ncbi:ATP-binding protein [Pelagibacteraceae bacterium]|nr:ATP-binding protein [Pelagibacteraceae bacterium]